MVQTSSVIFAATTILLAASPAIAADQKDTKSSVTTTTTTSATSTATSSSTPASKDSKDSHKGVNHHHHHHPHHHHRVHPHHHHHHHHHHKHLNGLDHIAHTEHHDEHNLLSHNHEHLKDAKAHGHEHDAHTLNHVQDKSKLLAQKVDLKAHPADKKVDLKAHPSSSSSVSLPSQTPHVEKAKATKPKTKLQLAIDELYKLNGREYYEVREEPEFLYERSPLGFINSRTDDFRERYFRRGAVSNIYARHPPPSAYLDPEVHEYRIERHPHRVPHSVGHRHSGRGLYDHVRPQGHLRNKDVHVGHSRPSYHEHEEFGHRHHEAEGYGYRHHDEERLGGRSWDDDMDEIMARSYYDIYDDLD